MNGTLLDGVTIILYGFWENIGKGYKQRKGKIQDVCNADGGVVDVIEDLCTQADSNGLRISVHSQVMKDTIDIISAIDAKGLASRTESYMLGIALKKVVVFTQWLEESITQETFAKEHNFMVTGDHISGTTNAPQRALEMNGTLLKDIAITLYGFWESEGKGYKQMKERVQDVINAAGGTVVRHLPKSANTSDTNLGDMQLTTLKERVLLIPKADFMNTQYGRQIQKFQVRKVDWLFEHIGTYRRPQVKPTNP